MRDYVEAKVSEFAQKFKYATDTLADLSSRGTHQNLAMELQRVCGEIDGLIRRVRSLVPLNLPQLFPRIQVMLAQINTRFELLEEWYLPATRQEGSDELAATSVINQVLSQLRISWIRDKVVSFSRALSMYPGIKDCPIFFMPRYTRISLMNWLGLYHEIAHTIYQRFPEIGSHLSDAVLLYCQQQLLQAPALTASQLDRRTERYRQTLSYWNSYRLEELFCDIFATVVAGPAYLFSWVDVSLTSLYGPYDVILADEHPPNAARTQACMLALHDSYAGSRLKTATTELWDGFLNRRTPPPLFNQMCPFELILAIVRAAQGEIHRLGFPTYQTPLPDPPQSLAYDRTDDLQNLVNVAVVNLMFARADFPAWQKSITDRLYPPATSGGGA
jgi:hypothetical protein